MKKLYISTSVAYLISIFLLVVAFVWTTFKPAAPFQTFIFGLGYLATVYGIKRLKQKEPKYNGENKL